MNETAVKEAGEEAGVPLELARKMTSAGAVSFFFETHLGFYPNTEFVFDLELPEEFQPNNVDGEVDSFILVKMEDVPKILTSEEMKTTSAPIALDFLVRHGFINPDNGKCYFSFKFVLLSQMHAPFQCQIFLI